MDRDEPITLTSIWREACEELDRLPKDGRLELVIYKSNNVLSNYDVRPVKQYKGRIAKSAESAAN